MDTIDKINYYLIKRGKKGSDLGRALGMSSGAYSQWNTRKTKPQRNKLPAIAEFLGVTIDDLLPDDEPPASTENGAKKAPDQEVEDGVGELSIEEKELIFAWRAMDQNDRAHQLAYLRFLAKDGKDK